MLSSRTLPIVCTLHLLLCLTSSEISNKNFPPSSYTGSYGPDDYMINKITLSQIGYIQFLKYMVEVPPMQEFTICTWVKSTNLTHPHSLLSYSRNEKERLIRVWLGAGGKDVNMAILEVDVFAVPLNLFENHWNHICSSWNAKRATWQLFINGKLRDTGVVPQLKDVIIPGEGDIVLGQEYTDFDKGLDDGIEGDIYGFNMILSSTLYPKVDTTQRRQIFIPGYPAARHHTLAYNVKETEDVPTVLSYFKPSLNREPKGLMDIGRSALQNFYSILETNPRVRVNPPLEFRQVTAPFYARHGLPVRAPGSTKRIYSGSPLKNELEGSSPKPLGLILVELGYNRCALGRGSPVTDARVLVSWTKTPVRIFGGAILRSVPPFCKRY